MNGDTDHLRLDYREALVVWDPGTARIKVGPLLEPGVANWTMHPHPYRMSGGGCTAEVAKADDAEATSLLLRDALRLVMAFHVHPEAVHREFMQVTQYRAFWSRLLGVDESEDGPEAFEQAVMVRRAKEWEPWPPRP